MFTPKPPQTPQHSNVMNIDMDGLDQKEQKALLKQFKKMYAEEMGKISIELSRRKQIKQNLSQLEELKQAELKKTQEALQKKMNQHQNKRQQYFKTKIKSAHQNDENWKFKMQEIQKQKRQKNRKSQEKAKKYRIQTQTFWSQQQQRKQRNYSTNHPMDQSSRFFTAENGKNGRQQQHKRNDTSRQDLYIASENVHLSKKKLQIGVSDSQINRTMFPYIQSSMSQPKSMKNSNFNTISSKQVECPQRSNEDLIKEHIEKSHLLSERKQQLILKKALQKLEKIQKNRKTTQNRLNDQAKKVKLRRRQIYDPSGISEKRRIKEQRLEQQRKYQSIGSDYSNGMNSEAKNATKSHFANNNALNESIIRHQHAKQQLWNEQFNLRQQVLQANIKKQKRGKIFKDFKEKMSKMKNQVLKNSDL